MEATGVDARSPTELHASKRVHKLYTVQIRKYQ